MSKRDQSTWRRSPEILESEHDEQEASRSARPTCGRGKGNALREIRETARFNDLARCVRVSGANRRVEKNNVRPIDHGS